MWSRALFGNHNFRRPGRPELLGDSPDGRLRVGLLMHQLDGELTGVGRYMASLTASLCHVDHGIDVIPLIVGPLGGLRSDPDVRQRVPSDGMVCFALTCTQRSGRLCGHRASLLTVGSLAVNVVARRLRLDVVHDLTGIAPFPTRLGTCRRMVTVHDLISYVPEGSNDSIDDMLQRRWLPRAARSLEGIVAVSASTKADVERLLHVSPSRIHVVPHGVDPHFREMPEETYRPTLAKRGLSPGYVLFIGSGSRRKNLLTLVAACRLLWNDGHRIQLVIAGPASITAEPAVQDELDASRIVQLGYTPEADLPALYNGASVFAFPSSYEGFGLPVLEAMRCGTPVLSGVGGALREVAGDAAVLIDPRDPAAMARELRSLVRDPILRARLHDRGLRRAQHFTWARTAERTAEVYRMVAAPPGSAAGQVGAARSS